MFVENKTKTSKFVQGFRGAEPPANLKNAWGQSQLICPKNIYPRPTIVMKQVYMKATKLNIDVVRFMFNVPLI